MTKREAEIRAEMEGMTVEELLRDAARRTERIVAGLPDLDDHTLYAARTYATNPPVIDRGPELTQMLVRVVAEIDAEMMRRQGAM